MGRMTDTQRRKPLHKRQNGNKLMDMKNGGKYKCIAIATTATLTAAADNDMNNTTTATHHDTDVTMNDNASIPTSSSTTTTTTTILSQTPHNATQSLNTKILKLRKSSHISEKQSSIIESRTLRNRNWSKTMAKKSLRQSLKDRTKELRAIEMAERKKERLRLIEAKKRKELNEKKSEVVVPITDSKKLKAMSRKALRHIRKA